MGTCVKCNEVKPATAMNNGVCNDCIKIEIMKDQEKEDLLRREKEEVLQAFQSELDSGKCPYCKEDIKVGAIICKHCRSDLTNLDIQDQQSTQEHSSNNNSGEEEVFNQYGVKITTKRVLIDNKTFALKNITSVSDYTHKDKIGFEKIFFGFVFIIGGANISNELGIVAIIIGFILIILGFKRNVVHYVVLKTSGGEEHQVLYGERADVRNAVTSALNEAIILN